METSQNALESNNHVSRQKGKTKNVTKSDNARSFDNTKLRSSLKIKKSKAKTATQSSTSQRGKSDQTKNDKSTRNNTTNDTTSSGPKKRRLRHRDGRIALIQQKIEQESRMAETNSASLLRRFTSTNAVLFVVLYSVAVSCQAAVERYTEALSHQPEHKYYFTRNSAVIFNVVQTIGLLISLAIVAFFARDAHKPFLIFLGLIICSLGSIVWSVPSFLDNSSFEGVIQECSNRSTLNFFYSEVCLKDAFMIDKSSLLHEVCSDCVSKVSPDWWSLRELRFLIMCLGGFAIGVGGGLYASLGFLYIEESNKGDKSCFFYGIILSMMGLGQFIGSFLAWWFLKYDEHLYKQGALKDHETRAWWLGTVVLSIIFFILSWFFLIFPKWIVEPNWVVAERYENIKAYKQLIAYVKEKKNKKREHDKKKAERAKKAQNKRKTTRGKTNSGYDDSGDKKDKEDKEDKDKQIKTAQGSYVNNAFDDSSTSLDVKEEISENTSKVTFKPVMTSTIEFNDPYDPTVPPPVYTEKPKPKVSRRLGKRCSALRDLFMVPSYSLFLLAVCLSSYFLAGYRPMSHVFVHHHYNYSLFNSWFYTTGLSNSLAWMLGSLIGGMVICKVRMTFKNQLLFMIIAIVFHCAFFFFIFSLSCSPGDSVMYNDTKVDECLTKYGCKEVQREPVCVKKDGVLLSYPSPCHAACSISGTGSCSSFTFSKDSCQEACPIYWAYWIFIFLATFTHALPSVTVILMFLRTVDEENKTMALSTAFWITKLIAYIPGRGIFDEISMSTCKEFRSNCLGETYCWKYHNDYLRYILHGSNVAFQAGAILLLFLLFILAINNVITIDYQHLINIRLDDTQQPQIQSTVTPSIRNKTGVDAIRKVVKVDEVVNENTNKDDDVIIERNDNLEESGIGNMKDKLRRHLQVVEMQLEKQNTPRASQDDLYRANNNLIRNSNNNYASRHRNSDVPIKQPKEVDDQLEKNFSWSMRDLKGMSIGQENRDGATNEGRNKELGVFNDGFQPDLLTMKDSQYHSFENIDIL